MARWPVAAAEGVARAAIAIAVGLSALCTSVPDHRDNCGLPLSFPSHFINGDNDTVDALIWLSALVYAPLACLAAIPMVWFSAVPWVSPELSAPGARSPPSVLSLSTSVLLGVAEHVWHVLYGLLAVRMLQNDGRDVARLWFGVLFADVCTVGRHVDDASQCLGPTTLYTDVLAGFACRECLCGAVARHPVFCGRHGCSVVAGGGRNCAGLLLRARLLARARLCPT
jgi:hypothetical protein